MPPLSTLTASPSGEATEPSVGSRGVGGEDRRAVWLGLAGVLLAFVVLATLHAVTVPPFLPADERSHAAYGLLVAQGRLPTLTTPAPLLLSPGAGPRIYTANHPPLYYALVATPLRLGLSTGHPMAGLVAARLLTVLTGAAGIAAVAALVLVRGPTARRLAALAAAAAAAALSRASGLPFAALAVLAAGLAPLVHGPRPPLVRAGAAAVQQAAMVGGVVLALAGWFYLRNRALYGDLTGTAENLRLFGLGEHRPVLGVLGSGRLWSGVYDQLWGRMAGSQFLARGPLALPGRLLGVLVIAGLAVGGVRAARSGRLAVSGPGPAGVTGRVAAWLLVLATVPLMMVAMAGYVAAGGGTHARYLYPALGAISLVAAVGLAWLPGRRRSLLVLAVLVGQVAFNLLLWTTFLSRTTVGRPGPASVLSPGRVALVAVVLLAVALAMVGRALWMLDNGRATVDLPPSPPATGRSPVPWPRWLRTIGPLLLEALPLLVPAMVAAFSLVAMVALQAGHLRPLVVLPLGLLAAAVAAWSVGLRRPEPLGGARWLDGVALALVLGFAAVNLRYSAQIIDVFRDPGVYSITGQWLARHGSLPIPLHPEVFGGVPSVSFYSAGFDPGTTAGSVHPQFSNLLPGLLAVGGWVGGDRLVLMVNPLIGSLALLAMYGLARQLVGRAWALVPLVALGVSLPQLQFSRGAYSEPVTMLLVLGGLALLREAQRRDRPWPFALAGLVLGACVLARVDGFYFLLVVPLVAAVELAGVAPAHRRERLAGVGALLLGVAVPAAVAMANLVNLSPAYLRGLRGELRMIAAAAVAVTLLGGAAVALAWSTTLLRRAAAARWLPAAAAGVVVLLAAIATSRPLWQVGHTPHAPSSQTDYIAFLQRAGGFRVDATRSYAEQTMAWLSWYWGPLVVVLGTAGVALAVHRLLARGDRLLVAPLGMLLSTALLYLTVPSIVPDQLWAMRRYLPVIIPGFLIAAAAALSLLARHSRAGLAAAVVLACGLVLFPLSGSARLIALREGVPQLVEVRNLCAAMPADAALVVTGSLGVTYQQTVRSYCDVPVAALRQPTRAHLAAVQAAARAHGRVLYLLATDPAAVAPDAGPVGVVWQPISCVGVTHLNAVLERAPDAWGAERRALLLGVVTGQGTVTPARSARRPLSFC